LCREHSSLLRAGLSIKLSRFPKLSLVAKNASHAFEQESQPRIRSGAMLSFDKYSFAKQRFGFTEFFLIPQYLPQTVERIN
jgi:hypothetical protein